MDGFILDLGMIDETHLTSVGGKGARLGELARLNGVNVPEGFCVTTEAFERIMNGIPSIDDHLDDLSRVSTDDRDGIRARSLEIRRLLAGVTMPFDLAEAITNALTVLGGHTGYAVRSSATMEDLATASSAGQQDSFLNILGPADVLEHIKQCWASLFTERAVIYRARNGIDSRKASMAVVVQKMVHPQVAGTLFTADPVTSNRNVASVEATFGLGEALVSSLVRPDLYKVRAGEIVVREMGDKRIAIVGSSRGGTRQVDVESERQRQPALTDRQVVTLVELGRRIESHFGWPQDIEWCLADEAFSVVQSRPITTLFPIPAHDDEENHLYVSVGHQQMMTDPMKPLGLSVWQLTAARPMPEAGGRLFVDVAALLASPTNRPYYLEALGRSDPLIGDALETILARGDFIPILANDDSIVSPVVGSTVPIDADPSIVGGLIDQFEASLANLWHEIGSKTGPALFDFISEDIAELKTLLFEPHNIQVIRAATDASWWVNQHMEEWLGQKNAVDVLTQSAPHNVTSEMGLALLDVADVIRAHPEVVAFLGRVHDDGFLTELPAVPGGQEARAAIEGYLVRYGMRCIGEIDITRPRWGERPSALIPMILSNVENFEPGAAARRFEQGRHEAQSGERELLEQLRTLPDGDTKARETNEMIERVRVFIGYREYPKYHIVSRYFAYKRALLQEAARLVEAGVLSEPEDIYYLRFDELREGVRTKEVDPQLIARRKEAFESFRALTPPRVLTSEGEVIDGAYRRAHVPMDALIGLGVSAGTVEGRARVVTDVADAHLQGGDILVTTYADPSWTPAFVGIDGLITEVGGLMTHGAVIAREYGLPAVVGVEHATTLIRDGQRVRVHGSEGYVELLTD